MTPTNLTDSDDSLEILDLDTSSSSSTSSDGKVSDNPPEEEPELFPRADSPPKAQWTLTHLVLAVSLALTAHFSYEHVVLTKTLHFEAARLNNTPIGEREVLFFNRVPKVGSQTVMNLLKALAARNNFSHFTDSSEVKKQSGERTFLSRLELKTYANMFLDNVTAPGVYNKHISYIDFKSLGDEYYRPVYVNFVREPVQRVISWYYYIRAPWYLFHVDDNSMYTAFKPGFGDNARRYKQSYEECVLTGDRECRYIPGHDHFAHREGGSHVSQIMFFCGHEPECRVIGSEWALTKAKENVEKYYGVVGVLEEMTKSLHVLERYIPRFFDGVVDIYSRRNEAWRHVNKNIYRPDVTREVRDMVGRNLTMEIEFYRFCRQRLNQQYFAAS